jgi:hypothetical protein
MKELKEIQKRLQDEGAFESVTPNVLYTGYMFDTWRDRPTLKDARTVAAER